MNKRPKVSIIIVNWNTKQLLKNCLESIFQSLRLKAESQKLKTEIIVVDNGSTDGSREYLRKLSRCDIGTILDISSAKQNEIKEKKISAKRISSEHSEPISNVTVIFNNSNEGFAKANNQGIEKANGDYILLLNSDTIIKDKAIEKTVNWMDENERADVVGCRLLNPDGTDQASVGEFPNLMPAFKMLFLDFATGGWSMRSPNRIEPVDWIMGAFMMVRRKVFDQVGGLDENIFMYMEEVEWCYRVKDKGYQIYFYPEAKITHIKGGSSKTGRTGPILNIYKGLIYFYKKHKASWQVFLVKLMLKTKAALAWFLGIITNNNYLKETYGKAYQLV